MSSVPPLYALSAVSYGIFYLRIAAHFGEFI